MSEGPAPAAGGRRNIDGLVLGAAAVAAYIGFGAVMMLHDGPRAGSAQAGVPVDAVRAAMSGRSRGSATEEPAFGVGAVIPDPARNTADAVASSPRVSLGVRDRGLGGAGVAVVGADGGGGDVRLQFVVKLEGDDATTWRDRFLADPDGARQEWARFAASNPAFAGLKLERMNYSGEATLEFEGSAPSAQSALQQLSDDIVRRLSAADGVEYAEPNLVGVREDEPR